MKRLLLIFFLLGAGIASAQTSKNEPLVKPGRIIFYNCENFFDTINDPKTKDDDFTPAGSYHWNTLKYVTKVQHLAKVIAAMLDTIEPIAIGLSEIENDKVLQDLIAQPALKKFNLGIIHHDSPDERGIDVALLYNKDMIEIVLEDRIEVDFSFDTAATTRDILFVKGYMTEEFPIYFFVNHWPSRRNANGDSEKKRITAAMYLKDKIDETYKAEPMARIVVMGDFNDNPDNKSLEYLCSGKRRFPLNQDLVNLMRLIQSRGEYTMKYNGTNDVFDQFIVSKNLLSSDNTYYVRSSAALVFRPRWLLFDHPKYGLIPDRTYASGKWVGGYSDHLPVYMDICFH